MGKAAKKKLPQTDSLAPASLMQRLAALQREFEEQLRNSEPEAEKQKQDAARELPVGTASPARTGDL